MIVNSRRFSVTLGSIHRSFKVSADNLDKDRRWKLKFECIFSFFRFFLYVNVFNFSFELQFPFSLPILEPYKIFYTIKLIYKRFISCCYQMKNNSRFSLILNDYGAFISCYFKRALRSRDFA